MKQWFKGLVCFFPPDLQTLNPRVWYTWWNAHWLNIFPGILFLEFSPAKVNGATPQRGPHLLLKLFVLVASKHTNLVLTIFNVIALEFCMEVKLYNWTMGLHLERNSSAWTQLRDKPHPQTVERSRSVLEFKQPTPSQLPYHHRLSVVTWKHVGIFTRTRDATFRKARVSVSYVCHKRSTFSSATLSSVYSFSIFHGMTPREGKKKRKKEEPVFLSNRDELSALS